MKTVETMNKNPTIPDQTWLGFLHFCFPRQWRFSLFVSASESHHH
jgi:hypothetical protein